MNSKNKDPFYPDAYYKVDQLSAYLEEQQSKILDILKDVEAKIPSEHYEKFVKELKEEI